MEPPVAPEIYSNTTLGIALNRKKLLVGLNLMIAVYKLFKQRLLL